MFIKPHCNLTLITTLLICVYKRTLDHFNYLSDDVLCKDDTLQIINKFVKKWLYFKFYVRQSSVLADNL